MDVSTHRPTESVTRDPKGMTRKAKVYIYIDDDDDNNDDDD